MKVLVAGGAGFLGSHLVERLVKHGDEVTVVDNLASGLLSNLQSVMEKVTFINNDINDFTSDERYDLIVNMASRASRVEWETLPVEVALTNSIGNNNLAKNALKNNSRYIYASTSEVYGNAETVPTPESYTGRVSSTGSRSPYDEGKRFGEALVKAYSNQYKLDSIIIRFFNTFGPRMRGGDFYGRVIDRFIQQSLSGKDVTVYGDGMQTRSFTYVDDTIDAVMKIVEGGENGEIYNVGTDRETTILGLAKLIIRETNSKSDIVYEKLPPDDPKRRAADISKLRSLGWTQDVSLEDGLRKMIKYYEGSENLNNAE